MFFIKFNYLFADSFSSATFFQAENSRELLLVFGAAACVSTILLVFTLFRMRKLKKFAEMEESLQMYKLMHQHMQLPMMLFDAKQNLVKINPQSSALAGKSTGDILASPCFQSYCKESEIPGYCPVKKCMTSGKPAVADLKISGRELRFFADPIFDARGDLLYVLETAVDMTEFNENYRKLTDSIETLRKKEEEHQLILNNLKIPIFLYSVDGKLLRFNTAARDIAGTDALKVAQVGCNNVFCKLSSRLGHCPVMTTVQTGRPDKMKIKLGDRDCIVYSEPVHDADGKVLFIIKSIVDVTEMEEGRRRQAEAIKTYQEAEKAKSYFLASVTHELRTPLNSILGFSELLQSEENREKRMEYLKSVRIAGESLLRLVTDLLDLSMLENGQLPLRMEFADLNALGRELIEAFRPEAEKKGLKIFMTSPALPFLRFDPYRMRQILNNLLSNAVGYTEAGEVELIFSFSTRDAVSGVLHIEVRDTGCGISPEDCRKLFEPFVQLSCYRGTTMNRRGSGLGLPISRRLIKSMGGREGVESVPGHGSRFFFDFDRIKYAQSIPGKKVSSIREQALKNLRILVVDDVPLNVTVLQAMLNKQGAETQTALSGADALNLLKNKEFDFILTDLWMPEMNGSQLVENIRKSGPHPELKIFAVTADVNAADNFDLHLFAGVIYKPVTVQKLLDALRPQPPSV